MVIFILPVYKFEITLGNKQSAMNCFFYPIQAVVYSLAQYKEYYIFKFHFQYQILKQKTVLYNLIKMSLLNSLKKMVYQFDLFCSSQLLRYNSQTQYKTLTGGLLSITIIVVIIVGFASMISQTFQSTSITSSLTVKKQQNPPLTTIRPGKQNMFMLGFHIQSSDLRYLADLFKGPQYFTLALSLMKIQNGVPNKLDVPLQQCTKEHWSMIPSFNVNSDSFHIDKWACLPLSISINLQGVFSSPLNQLAMIKLFRCKNSTSNSNSCASEEQIDTLFNTYSNFYLTFSYVNPVINPNQPTYKSFYMQSNDYTIFSKNIGAQAWIYFSDYQINTDTSILPFQKINADTGFIVQEKAINHPYGMGNNSPYATIYLAKSINSLRYTRQVQKISAVFSYIGGLIGAIITVLFFVNMYTDSSLQISIGMNLFDQEKLEEKTSFSLIKFMRLSLYRIFKFFGRNLQWKITQKLFKYQDEVVKQLDVQFLLKRLIKLEGCMAYFFTQDELEEIREGQTITIENAKKMRTLLFKREAEEQQQKEQNNGETEIPIKIDKNEANNLHNLGINSLKIEEISHYQDTKIQSIAVFNRINQAVKLHNDHKQFQSKDKIHKSLKIHPLRNN